MHLSCWQKTPRSVCGGLELNLMSWGEEEIPTPLTAHWQVWPWSAENMEGQIHTVWGIYKRKLYRNSRTSADLCLGLAQDNPTNVSRIFTHSLRLRDQQLRREESGIPTTTCCSVAHQLVTNSVRLLFGGGQWIYLSSRQQGKFPVIKQKHLMN